MKRVGTLRKKVNSSKRTQEKDVAEPAFNPLSLETSLETLDFISKRMSKMALIIFILTIFNIGFPFFIFSGALYGLVGFHLFETIGVMLIIVWIISILSTLVTIYIYESYRKRGDVIFEEISDELEWNVKNHAENHSGNTRPEISARISLRAFAKTTDLPFIPGKFGPAFYLIFNILISIFIGSRFLFRF